MTLEEKYELSCYQELTKQQANKEIYQEQHVNTAQNCEKNEIDT